MSPRPNFKQPKKPPAPKLFCAIMCVLVLLFAGDLQAQTRHGHSIQFNVNSNPPITGTPPLFSPPVDINGRAVRPFAQQANRRPRVGVVFGGGGAAGVCHVGVLKVLEEYGIPVDCISGTSMGSIVAGLYATGMSASELEKIVNEFHWNEVLNEASDHGHKYERRKTDDYLFPPAISVGVEDGQVNLGRGFVSGQYLTSQLRRLLASANHVENFDQLPIPFRTLATDVETGEIVVFRNGNLATAIRASMSIPAVFPPVRIGNRLLVDGGLRNNVPTDLAREMGADILIVVQLPTQLKKAEELKNAFAITGQSLSIVTANGNSHKAKGLTKSDILIMPDMNGIGTLDFQRTREGVELGAVAARQHHEQLTQLASLINSFQPRDQFAAPVRLGAPEFLQVDRIQINNRSSIASDESIAARLTVQPGQPFWFDQIDSDIRRIYGTGNFGNVDYTIRTDDLGQQVLDINALEDSRGKTLVTLGLGLEEDFSGDSYYSASLSTVWRGLNRLGGEGRFLGQLGSHQHVLLDFYQPINHGQTTFIRPFLDYDSYVQPVFTNTDVNLEPVRFEDIQLREAIAGIEAGQTFGDHGVLTFGAFTGQAYSKVLTGAPFEEPSDSDGVGVGGAYTEFKIDTLDSYFLPTAGFLGSVKYTNFSTGLGHSDSSDMLQARVITARTYGSQTFIFRFDGLYDELLTAGDTFRNESAYGGFLQLSGYSRNQTLAARRAQGAFIYLKHLKSLAGKQVSLYSGCSAEVGVFDKGFNVPDKRAIVAASVFVAADTPLGPIFVGYGHNDDTGGSGFIAMGQTF